MNKARRWWSHTGRVGRGVTIAAAVLLLVSVAVYYASDALLRRFIERGMNRSLTGYTAQIGAAHFHLFGFSVDLDDTRVAQNAYPNPPVIFIPQLHASVHWQALLRGHLVADFRFDRPRLYVNLPQLRAEERDPTPVGQKGWQEALQSIYPLKINTFRIVEAELVYQDEGSSRPLRLSKLNLLAGNIRNIATPNDVYPSTVSLNAVVFDSGKLSVDGKANFLAVPHMTLTGAYQLDRVALDYFKPITNKYNVEVRGGTLTSTGRVEYTTDHTTVEVAQAQVQQVDIEYTHAKQTAQAESARASKVKSTVRATNNSPTTSISVDKLDIVRSTFGFRDASGSTPYRLFLADTDIHLSNLTNQGEWGQARGTLTGRFMASGATTVDLNLRPDGKSVDMNLALKIEGADVTRLNDMLMDFVGFTVSGGSFALYTQTNVRQGHVEGYIKPIFTDLKVVDPQHDAEKNFVQKVRERIAALIAAILKNPNHEIATTVTLKGKLDDPQYSTWEAVAGLLKNAFIQPLLHRFGQG